MSKGIDDIFYAYGNEYADIETVMRFSAVKRWHMIDTTRIQTLSEHSGNVALLVYGISATAPNMFFGSPDAAAGIALLHDLPEVFTGDYPGHSKRFVQGLSELEKSVLPSCYINRPSDNLRHLIKVCDLVDGIRHIRLHGVDITARQAREQIEEKLRTLCETLEDKWPKNILRHVRHWATFYAYENS